MISIGDQTITNLVLTKYENLKEQWQLKDIFKTQLKD
jgi:hypothetical protein